MDTTAAGTKGRILDAAERLFGEHGFANTSLRALTEAADVNVAAVNYHFGSKERLLRAVVHRAMASVNDDRERILEELQTTGRHPGVEELVQAFVETGMSLAGRQGDRGNQVTRFIGRVMFEPDPAIRRLFASEVGPSEGRYLEALIVALPHLSPEEVAFRYRAMVGLLALHQAGTLVDLQPTDEPASATPQDTGQLKDLLVGALRAPSSHFTPLH